MLHGREKRIPHVGSSPPGRSTWKEAPWVCFTLLAHEKSSAASKRPSFPVPKRACDGCRSMCKHSPLLSTHLAQPHFGEAPRSEVRTLGSEVLAVCVKAGSAPHLICSSPSPAASRLWHSSWEQPVSAPGSSPWRSSQQHHVKLFKEDFCRKMLAASALNC